jgi:glycosyltransferase involved in cell wall biosynthesis
MATRSDAIITVSAFTKSQVVGLLGVDAARVHVVHHGTRPLSFPKLEREPVVLNVGAIQKRKNIGRLVEAFEMLEPPWRLVLAGSCGFGSEEIQARIEESSARARISVLGYVSPADLAAWYARATIFAFPSLDEGFGMPLLEAMAAGTPILTSNRSALPEVAGDAAVLVNPEDAGQIGAELHRLANNSILRKELERKGLARARLFTWEGAVRSTWQIYESLLR